MKPSGPGTRLLSGLLLVGLATGLLTAMPASAAESAQEPAAQRPNEQRVIATSAQGRPIVARHYGAGDAEVQVVVIGQMHGNEPGGRAVVRELAARPAPDGVGMWLITSLNPDGHRAGTRVNARGVDLNRNFPYAWSPSDRGGDWSGRGPASEPETRGVMRFLARERPTAVLSLHQSYDVVDISHRRSRDAGRMLARWMGERARVVGCSGPCRGTMTQWIDRSLRTIAITVELDGSVSRREARVMTAAVHRLGQWLGG